MLTTLIIFHTLSLGCFLLTFTWLKLIEDWRQMMSVLSVTFKDLSNNQLSDMEKEALSRKASTKLFGFVFRLSWKSALTVGALMFPVVIAHYALAIPLFETIRFSLKPIVLIITLLVSVAAFYIASRCKQPCRTPKSND